MAKYKIMHEHPSFGVFEFEIVFDVDLERMREIATWSIARNGGRLIDVVQVDE